MRYGTNQYQRLGGGGMQPREIEAAAFSFVNKLLRDGDDDARMRGLAKNQLLWSMLLKDVGDRNNGLPPVLKGDVIKLGLWSMRYSITAMSDDRSVKPLVQVNEDMIAALQATGGPAVGGTALRANSLVG